MVKNFQGNVDLLLERMQKVSAQGKHIAVDATVQVRYSVKWILIKIPRSSFRNERL